MLEHREENMGSVVGAILGLRIDDDASDAEEHSFGFTHAEIEEMGQGLPPGGSAGLRFIEHVWAAISSARSGTRAALRSPASADHVN